MDDLILKSVKMIDPIMGWFEILQYKGKIVRINKSQVNQSSIF